MKKTYISPKILTVTVGCAKLIAQSIIVNANQNIGSSTNFVKENRTYRDYNVWDDDWSN